MKVGNFPLIPLPQEALARGKYFECYDEVENLLVPIGGLTVNYSFETTPNDPIAIEDVMDSSLIFSANGFLKTRVSFFLKNSLLSGGFTITPGTGTIINNASSLNGKFTNIKPKVIIKKNPTIVNLPSTSEFIFILSSQKKASSGNSFSQSGGGSLFFNQIRYVSIPKAEAGIIQVKFQNLEGSNFNIDQIIRFFFLEAEIS